MVMTGEAQGEKRGKAFLTFERDTNCLPVNKNLGGDRVYFPRSLYEGILQRDRQQHPPHLQISSRLCQVRLRLSFLDVSSELLRQKDRFGATETQSVGARGKRVPLGEVSLGEHQDQAIHFPPLSMYVEGIPQEE